VKISDLTALLSRVQQIAGDVDVVLQAADTEAETVITDLGIHLDPASGSVGSSLTITHGTAPAPPPAAPVDEQTPAA
jgi:hypothetical protein